MALVCVVIPVFNEDLSTLSAVIRSLIPLGYELVVIDDGSKINFERVLRDIPVAVLTHSLNLGQGASIQTGLDYARKIDCDFVVTFDGDGQHQAADIGKLLAPLITNQADVALGSRFIEGSYHNASFGRQMIFKLARQVNQFLFKIPFSDTHNGLRAFNRFALEKVSITENRMAHASEILSQIVKQKLRAVEVPVQVQYTKYSRKKGQGVLDGIKIFFDLFLYKIFR